MAYSDKVLDHYENPRNVGSFAKGDDAAFYRGKLAAARFYAKNVLPGLTLSRHDLDEVYRRMVTLADTRKHITDDDLIDITSES